jgi:two-component system nitrogen regulation response regulator GlnG
MTKREHIWVIDDDRSIRWVLERAFKQAGMDVSSFESAQGVMEELERAQPDAIVSDIRMPGVDGLHLLGQIRDAYPDLPVIIMTAHSDLDSAVSAYQGGAFEYLPKPFDVDEAVALVHRAVEYRRERGTAHAEIPSPQTTEIIGEAPAMQEVFRAIGRLARSNITVLINGESGTGKELVARALHRHSPRAQNTFIALNMASIPRDLLESELFGHERGAFTGAQNMRRGRFEQADGGTLFLDEIGDMPAELQTRLLRVLSDGEFYRVGGHTPIKVDVRIIAATHQNLEDRVKDGRFREDLFHRLNVIRIHIPPLRERREDLPQLTRYFLNAAAEELNVESKVLRPEVLDFMVRKDWPGNVRQLENACRWLTVMASGREVHMEDLPPELRSESGAAGNDAQGWDMQLRRWAEQQLAQGDSDLLNIATPIYERTLIEVALQRTGGRRQDAAKLLGWGRNTLTRKIKELAMETGPDSEDNEDDDK